MGQLHKLIRGPKPDRAKSIYRLVPLLKPGAELNAEQAKFLGLPEGEAFFLDGEDHKLGDYLFISVPPSMPREALVQIQDAAVRLFDRSVVLLTHQIAFLRVSRVSEREARKMAGEGKQKAAAAAQATMERIEELRRQCAEKAASDAKESAAGESTELEREPPTAGDDGPGSGPGRIGDSGGELDGAPAAGDRCDDRENEKGDEKGAADDPGVH